jgi:hypothetical protein
MGKAQLPIAGAGDSAASAVLGLKTVIALHLGSSVAGMITPLLRALTSFELTFLPEGRILMNRQIR